jgi:hypothetical protein
MASGAAAALATFELENNVQRLDVSDEIFRLDEAAQRANNAQKPWRDNPRYFKQCVHAEATPDSGVCRRSCAACLCTSPDSTSPPPPPCSVRVSALALVKMTMHCRSGGNLEVRVPCAG